MSLREKIKELVMTNRLADKLIEQGQNQGSLYQAALGVALLPFHETLRVQDEEAVRDIIISIDYYKELHRLLQIGRILEMPMSRVGGDKDGGYVMLDDFRRDSIAYSFGIGPDASWDNEMAEKGYSIYMYDHTIQDLPMTRKEFHFFKEGIAGEEGSNPKLHTLQHFVEVNGHNHCNGMILKMDIEGYEWEVLDTVGADILRQFDQIVFEFHGMICSKYAQKIIFALDKLNKTHICVHLHPNNYGRAITINGKLFPNCLEALYVNRDRYEYASCNNDICLPSPLDVPDCPGLPEFALGYWNHPMEETGDYTVMNKFYI